MQIGYNNDVEYRGKTFHIQTEDRGLDAAQIETQIFHAGAILDTSILEYGHVLEELDDEDERIAKIRHMMQANHRSLYKKLHAGEYDEFAGLEPLDGEVEIDAPAPDEFAPGQDRVPQAALEVERGNTDALGDMGDVEHVDLSTLQDKLEGVAGADDEEVDAASPTMVTTPEEIQAAMAADEERREKEAAEKSAPPTVAMPAISAPTPSTPDRSSPPASPSVPSFKPTGATAWRGCEPTDEDLSLTEFVEAFVAG